MSSSARKAEIQKLYEEGRQASLAGHHSQTCPHRFEDRRHWMEGYDEVQHTRADFITSQMTLEERVKRIEERLGL